MAQFFQNFADEYTGELKTFLDRTCATLNDTWPDAQAAIEQELLQFEASVETTFNIFGRGAFRKWTPNGYERLFNRAIFDIMTYYFSNEQIRGGTAGHKAAVEQAFKDLCENNQDFLGSIERTTKSIGATTIRLGAWANVLSNITGQAVASPL